MTQNELKMQIEHAGVELNFDDSRFSRLGGQTIITPFGERTLPVDNTLDDSFQTTDNQSSASQQLVKIFNQEGLKMQTQKNGQVVLRDLTQSETVQFSILASHDDHVYLPIDRQQFLYRKKLRTLYLPQNYCHSCSKPISDSRSGIKRLKSRVAEVMTGRKLKRADFYECWFC